MAIMATGTGVNEGLAGPSELGAPGALELDVGVYRGAADARMRCRLPGRALAGGRCGCLCQLVVVARLRLLNHRLARCGMPRRLLWTTSTLMRMICWGKRKIHSRPEGEIVGGAQQKSYDGRMLDTSVL